jgi:putative transposase
MPDAISRQNSRSISRRSAGAPGDFIGDRPVNSIIHPAGRPIITSNIKVLRRPVESGQYLAIRYSERLAEKDIVASVGSTGDSYDNAMAEAFNSLSKWELIYPQGPWRGLDDVEFATLGYLDWFNHRRLHGEITEDNSYVTPAQFEATSYRQTAPALEAVTQTSE